MADEPFRAELSPESLRKIMLMAKEASPRMKRKVYNGIREAAEPAAEAARAVIRGSLPPKADNRSALEKIRRKQLSTRTQHTGLREGIAKGVSVGLGSGAATTGVRITSSARFLHPNQKTMNRVWNQDTFRHPVFGRGSVQQHGQPWFFDPIRQKKDSISRAVLEAMQSAADELGGL